MTVQSITSFEQEMILKAIHDQLGETAKIWLFGSRVDDNKKGGDIDLYVETDRHHPDCWQRKIFIISTLQTQIGDQKIDIFLVISAKAGI